MFCFFPRLKPAQGTGRDPNISTAPTTPSPAAVLASLLLLLGAAMPHDTAAMPAAAPKPVSLIVACTGEGGIGKDGQLPWRLPGDMAYFKRVTTGGSAADAGTGEKLNAVVMGRKTWDSIPAKFRPLAGRVNVVLSRNPGALGLPADVLGATSLPDALSAVDDRADIDQCFIIGGAEVYREALKLPRLCKVVARSCTCAWTDAPGACLVAHLCRACKMLWDAAPLYVVCVLDVARAAGLPDPRARVVRLRRFHSCGTAAVVRARCGYACTPWLRLRACCDGAWVVFWDLRACSWWQNRQRALELYQRGELDQV